VASVEDAECLECPTASRRDENVDQVKGVELENKNLSMKLRR
jgi:hypothetical protein